MGRRPKRAAAAAIGTVLALLGACTPSGKSAGAPDGALQIVLETDLQVPKDLDRVTVQVTQKSQSLLSVDQDLGPGALLLPATFVVKSTSDPSAVTIHAVGYKNHAPAVERDAVTPIPTDASGVLHLALDYLCLGTAAADPDGGVSSTCANGLTCVLGQCATAIVPPAALVMSAGPEDASVEAGPEGCFDVATCFASATPVTVDPTSCTATLAAGTDPATLNVGLQFPVGGVGVCGLTACWVSLTGWTLNGSQLQLPAAACTDAAAQGAQIVVSTGCYSEAPDMTPCGPGSSVVTVAPQPPRIGMSCDPPGSQACGQCGTQTRTCNDGVWSAWMACTGEGPCAPGAAQSCGVGGTQTCGADCQWGACGCTGTDLACGAPGTCASSTDLHTCGSCANDCTALPHVSGATTCSAGTCVIPPTSCAPGYGDCNGDPTDGCETALNVAGHCNSCSTVCPGTAPTCDSSTGTPHCVSTCAGTTCGSSCVNVSTNAADCGTCGNVCPNPSHAQGTCVGGKCASSCNSGYTTCSGVCTSITGTDASNCGACGHVCPSGSSCASGKCTCAGSTTRSCGNCGTQTATCNDGTLTWSACSMPAGACTPGATEPCETNGTASCSASCAWGACACDAGYSLCSGACMNYQQDPKNCGSCGKVCSLANAAVGCASGGCTVASCTTGYGDCNKTAADGCEVNLNTDAKNCGTCGAPCSLANAASTCSGGSCALGACTTGFANCDGKPANGCEANLSTDGNNCGTCGTVCGAGSSCQGGTCKCTGNCQQVTVETAFQPVGLAVDGTNVYWTDVNTNGTYTYPSQYVTQTPQYSGVIMEAPIGGGTPLMLAWDMVAPEGIAVDATSVYWTNVASGQIMKTSIGKQMVPTTLYTDPTAPHAIAVNATNVFWICEDGTVKTVPLAGATTATQVNFGSLPYSGDTPGGLAVDATNVYYAEDGNIWQVPANSSLGKGLSLASGLTNPFGIAVDAHNVYWTNFNTASATDAVMQVPISGSASVTVAPMQQDAFDIVVDSTSVYWTDYAGPTPAVMKAPIGGGTPITLATLPAGQWFTNENVPLGLAVDSTSVYWLTSSTGADAGPGTGAIMKVAK